jgi:hypothetical protein
MAMPAAGRGAAPRHVPPRLDQPRLDQPRLDVPRLVLAVGVRGSASTWAFNVARELMEAALGAAAVTPCFVNTPDDLAAAQAGGAACVVCKTHGVAGLDRMARQDGARVIITVRDPRDAVLSLIERFGTPPQVALRGVAESCNAVLGCTAQHWPVLRYEDGFFARADTVALLARHLGLDVAAAEVARIFAAWRTEAVRAFAATVPTLPAGRLVDDGGIFCFDRLTQVHRTHIGDGRVGKWRERFAPKAQAELGRVFAPFLDRFRYDMP